MFSSDKKFKIYLSGPIEFAKDNGANWRELAEKRLLENDFLVFNPVTASDNVLSKHDIDSVASYNKLKTEFDGDVTRTKLNRYINVTKDFIKLDIHELRTSDMVLACINNVPSAGTAGEITLAKHLGIPVVAFIETDLKNVSGWLLGCVDFICYNDLKLPVDPSFAYSLQVLERIRASFLNG